MTVNLVTVLDKDIENAWCVPPVDSSGSTDLIQAVEFRGFGTENFETKRYDISSISVTPMFVSAVDLQALYNKGKGRFRMRQGARLPDHLRLDSRFEYERRPFNYPVAHTLYPLLHIHTRAQILITYIHTYIRIHTYIFSPHALIIVMMVGLVSEQFALVAPPILFQERSGSSGTCKTTLGTHYQDKTWRDIINGTMCALPFQCDQDLLNVSTSLLACDRYHIWSLASFSSSHFSRILTTR